MSLLRFLSRDLAAELQLIEATPWAAAPLGQLLIAFDGVAPLALMAVRPAPTRP